MNDALQTTSTVAVSSHHPIIPAPQHPIVTRVATMGDLPFMDGLQKRHSKALGYFPTKQFEGYIEMGGVLLAEADGAPVGYCISRDRYLKRDELGVIYQLCVAAGDQRKLVGASLIKAVFDRSAYGCRLYCCWCAQDLAANYFWESLGFVPIAFRGGSGKKKRVHLFWQRRIREGDTQTPWWFPSKTDQGAMREDRLVLPIPPGLHWSDEMPVMRPAEAAPKLPAPAPQPIRITAPAPVKTSRRLTFAPIAPPKPPSTAPRAKKPAAKIDPKFLAGARELRDRYLERVNESPEALPAPAARYDVSRSLIPPDVARALPDAA